jgi:peptidoglycan/LPS O-acetylase OafA/YrhL
MRLLALCVASWRRHEPLSAKHDSPTTAMNIQEHDAWKQMKGLAVGRLLAEYVEAGRDNILQLRLLAALMVVFGHSYVLVGHDAALDEPLHLLLGRTYAHLVGVALFFTISGFLITLSYLRRPDLMFFLRARFLRLWPALIVVVSIWAFVLGPLFSTVPLHSYFSTKAPYNYFLTNISLFAPDLFLPGLFATNPVPYYVNGSLWTIPYEAALYACVAVTGALGLLRFPRMTSIAIVVVFVTIVLWPMYTGAARALGASFLGLQLAGCFGAGSIACLLRRYIPISTGLMILVAAASLLLRDTPFLWLAVIYFVFWFAYVPRLPAIPRQADLSYGTYLWAFPVQQTIVLVGHVTSPILLFTITAPLVLTIATISWSYVEKPALRLKNMSWIGSRSSRPVPQKIAS